MGADARGAALVCAAMLLFTLNDAMLKLAGGTLPAEQVMVLRGLTAGLALYGVIRLTRLPLRARQALAPMPLVRAVCDALASILFVYALLDLPIATVTAFIQAVPILSSVAGALLFKEVIGGRQWLALALCMCGVTAITGIDIGGNVVSFAIMLGAVGLMVVRDLATRSTAATVPSLTVALTSTLAVPLLSMPLATPAAWAVPDLSESLLITGTALCVGAATLMLISAMRVATLARIAPFRYAAMVFSVLVGMLVWGEYPDAYALFGVCLILIGGVLGGRCCTKGRGIHLANPM